MNFFLNADPVALEEIELQAYTRLKMLKEQTQEKLLEVIAEKKQLGMKVEIEVMTS